LDCQQRLWLILERREQTVHANEIDAMTSQAQYILDIGGYRGARLASRAGAAASHAPTVAAL